MQSKELLISAIQGSQQLLLPLLEDMRGAPLQFPTPHGGNHPLWILGHLAHAEGFLLWQTMRGAPNPVAHWDELFKGGSEPVADAGRYPSFDELLAKFHELRGQTMTLLQSLGEDELDRTSANFPPDFEPFFGTWRRCFLALALHSMNHRGQVADCRRAAGRKPLFA